MAEVLGKMAEDKVVEVLQKKPFCIATDGGTDYHSTATKLFPLVVRYYDEVTETIISTLLTLVNLELPSTGENIFNLMSEGLAKFEIPWGNVIGFAADNASTMLGRNDGVAGRIIRLGLDTYILGCGCHLVHLAAKAGGSSLLVDIGDIIVSIYYYLDKSSNRHQNLKLFMEEHSETVQEIIKHIDTRWLSLERSNGRLISQWQALKAFFAAEYVEAKANKIKKEEKTKEKQAKLEAKQMKENNSLSKAQGSSTTKERAGTSIKLKKNQPANKESSFSSVKRGVGKFIPTKPTKDGQVENIPVKSRQEESASKLPSSSEAQGDSTTKAAKSVSVQQKQPASKKSSSTEKPTLGAYLVKLYQAAKSAGS